MIFEPNRMLEQLGVFAKYWQPGAVKTRLAADLGDRAASELYRAFLITVLRRFADFADHCVLAYTPNERRAEIAQVAPASWHLQPQGEGDLGTRMERYFDLARKHGSTHTLLIGSDSPNLPTEFLVAARQALKTAAVVIGPSTDGGYYLIGLREESRAQLLHEVGLFRKMAWSTADVLPQTLERLRQSRLSWHLLPEWYDVDTRVDLQRLLAELDPADATWNLIRATWCRFGKGA